MSAISSPDNNVSYFVAVVVSAMCAVQFLLRSYFVHSTRVFIRLYITDCLVIAYVYRWMTFSSFRFEELL